MQDDDNQNSSSALIEILQSTGLFSQIHEEVAERLLNRLKKTELAAGEILFEEGSISDTFFILIEGHLIALLKTDEGKEKVIGNIEVGETVGEMGAISQKPRSLTVKASVHSKLLMFTRSEFEMFSKEHPQILMNLINYLIDRSQKTISVLSEKRIHTHVAIIQGNQQTDITHFMGIIKEYLTEKQELILIDGQHEPINLSKEIAKAEIHGKKLIFVLTPDQLKTLEAKINHLAAIYIVVNGDTTPEFSDFALEMAQRHHNPFVTEVRLVLLHDDKIVVPKETIRWLSQANFSMHHHVRINNKSDYERLIRYISGNPVCVVLGGGGGKGWACIGAIKALIDSNIPIDAIGGTSVGALIGACLAEFQDYDTLFKKFKEMSQAADKPFSLKNFTWPLISLLSAKKPTESLQEIFGKIEIEDLWLPFFSVATNLSTGKEVIHQTGKLWERLRASMALPGIVPPVVIDGQIYVDGGLMNNLPVDTMRTLAGKDAIIIAISLSRLGEDKKIYNFPPFIPFRVGLMRKLGLGYKDYKFPPYFSTFVSALMIGSSSREKVNRLKADLLICPDLSSYHTLKLDINQRGEIVKLGYLSAAQVIQAEQHVFNKIKLKKKRGA